MPPYRNRVRARYRPYGRRGWKINQNRIPPGMEPVAGLGFMQVLLIGLLIHILIRELLLEKV